MMEQKNTDEKTEGRREQMIEFIMEAIKRIDDKKLRNIYNFVLHIQ